MAFSCVQYKIRSRVGEIQTGHNKIEFHSSACVLYCQSPLFGIVWRLKVYKSRNTQKHTPSIYERPLDYIAITPGGWRGEGASSIFCLLNSSVDVEAENVLCSEWKRHLTFQAEFLGFAKKQKYHSRALTEVKALTKQVYDRNTKIYGYWYTNWKGNGCQLVLSMKVSPRQRWWCDGER